MEWEWWEARWKRNWVSGQPCWHEQQAETMLRNSAVCLEWNFLCKTSPLVQFVSTVLGDIFAFSHQGPLKQVFNSVCQLSSCSPEHICMMLGDIGPQMLQCQDFSLLHTRWQCVCCCLPWPWEPEKSSNEPGCRLMSLCELISDALLESPAGR